MKTTPAKTATARKPASDQPSNDRSTLAAFYIFAAALVLSLIYFLTLVFFI